MGGEFALIEICILLLDADPTSLASMRNLLLEAKHEVVTADKGQDALCMLREQQHEGQIQLVLTAMKLPDMCTFEFVEIVEKETGLPVVMICDTYDEPTMLRGLSHGAIFCLTKPVSLHDVEDLWQHCKVKERRVMLGLHQLPVLNDLEKEGYGCSPFSISEMTPPFYEWGVSSQGSSQGHRKMKMEEMVEGEGSSADQPLSSVWTPSLLGRFHEIVEDLSLNNPDAILSEESCSVNAPRHSSGLVTERFRLDQKSQMNGHSESSNSQNPFVRVDWSLNFDVHTNYGPSFGPGQHSQFMEILKNPHLMNELRRTLDDTLLKWLTDVGSYVNPDMIWQISDVDQVQGCPHQTSLLSSPDPLLGAMLSLEPTGLPGASELLPALVPVYPEYTVSGFIPSPALSVTGAPAELLVPQVESEMQAGEPSSPFPYDVLEAFMDDI